MCRYIRYLGTVDMLPDKQDGYHLFSFAPVFETRSLPCRQALIRERCGNVFISRLMKADVAIANLNERKPVRLRARGNGLEDAHAADRKRKTCAGPADVLEKALTLHFLSPVTMTQPRIFGCISQKYAIVPGFVKVCFHDWCRSRPSESNDLLTAEAVCGSLSSFTNVTVVPAGIVRWSGLNEKFTM